MFHALRLVFYRFLRISDTANIDTEFYLVFPLESRRTNIFPCMERMKILKYMFESDTHTCISEYAGILRFPNVASKTRKNEQ
jgi:hypothetical protein